MSNKSSIFALEMEMKKATYQTPQTQVIGELPVMCWAGLSGAPNPKV